MKNSKILLCTSAMMVVSCFTCKTNAAGKKMFDVAREAASVARRITIPPVSAGTLHAYSSAVKPSLPTFLFPCDRYTRPFATDAKPVFLPVKEEKIDKPDDVHLMDPRSVFQEPYIPTAKPTIPLLNKNDSFKTFAKVLGENCYKTAGTLDSELSKIAKEAYDVSSFVGAREIASNVFKITPRLLSDDVRGIMSRWEGRLAKLVRDGFITFTDDEVPCIALTERSIISIRARLDRDEISKEISIEKENNHKVASNIVAALRNISTTIGQLYVLVSGNEISERWPCSSVEYLIRSGRN